MGRMLASMDLQRRRLRVDIGTCYKWFPIEEPSNLLFFGWIFSGAFDFARGGSDPQRLSTFRPIPTYLGTVPDIVT